MEFERKQYLDQLIKKKDNGRVKVITGLKRSGKSYLLFNLFRNNLMETGVGEDQIIALALDEIDNAKYKHFFGAKAKMIPGDEVERIIGHAIGGVCSFGINEGVKVYLDVSLKRFTTFFPACGSCNSAIELTCEELEKYSSNCQGWVDLCKGWQQEEG